VCVCVCECVCVCVCVIVEITVDDSAHLVCEREGHREGVCMCVMVEIIGEDTAHLERVCVYVCVCVREGVCVYD